MSCANETESFDVTWNIENFSECLFEEGISLGTPIFKTNIADGNSHTWWKLYLETGESSISSLTVKLEKRKGLSLVSKFELSLSTAFGVIKLPQEEGSIGDSCYQFTVHKSAIFSFLEKRLLIFPQIPKNVLTINCKIWHEMIMIKPGKILFGSVLQKGFASFTMLHNLDTVIYDQDHLQVTMTSYEHELCKYHNSKKVCTCYRLLVEILPSRGGWHSFVKSKLTCLNYSTYNDYIVSQKGRLTCSTRIWDLCGAFVGNKLELEFIVAVEMVELQKPYPLISSPLENLEDKDLSSNPAALASFKTVSEDLLHLYSEKLLSDATLSTEGKSFSAHRNILSARSSVFRAMFEKDEMSEGRSGVVDINDVDSATVDRMLVFLYGDSLKDLQWKEASALYYAADKYAIHTLKKKCSDILKAGLEVENFCDALCLAEKHSDQELMRCTVDFIRNHQEVLSSSEWDKLEERNLRLAASILREVVVKKRKYREESILFYNLDT